MLMRRPGGAVRAGEGGYQFEYPLMVMGTLLLLALLVPSLPVWLAKVVVTAGCVPLLFGLYYMVVTPGWQPRASHLPRLLRLALFVLLAAGVVIGVGAWVVSGFR